MNGFVRAFRIKGNGCEKAPTTPPCPRTTSGPDGARTPDVMGYHTAARDPELLGLRRRPSRCTTACSRRPIHGPCRRTCSWCRGGRRAARFPTIRWRASPNQRNPGDRRGLDLEELDARRGRAAALHLGRHHLAPVPGGGLVGLLRGAGQLHRGSVRGLRRHRDPGRAEPAAGLPHGRRHRAARQRAAEHRLHRGREGGNPAERLVGDADRGPGRAPARTRSPTVRSG